MHIAVFAPLDLVDFLFGESGTFEIFSTCLWFLLAVVCLCGRFTVPIRLAAAAAAVLFGLREMDLHKSLSDMSFLKIHFYRSGFIPLSDKLAGIAIILFLLFLVFYLGRTFLKHLRQSPRSWQAAYGYTVLALILLAASKFADRLNAQLNKLFDITLSERSEAVIRSLEESTEMVLPVLFCIAVFLYQPESDKKSVASIGTT